MADLETGRRSFPPLLIQGLETERGDTRRVSAGSRVRGGVAPALCPLSTPWRRRAERLAAGWDEKMVAVGGIEPPT